MPVIRVKDVSRSPSVSRISQPEPVSFLESENCVSCYFPEIGHLGSLLESVNFLGGGVLHSTFVKGLL